MKQNFKLKLKIYTLKSITLLPIQTTKDTKHNLFIITD